MSTHVSIKKNLILLAATLMMLPAISASDNHSFDTNICLPQEKVYLHFDNTSYYHGDKIWFKAYVVLAPTHGMTPLSQTLHVELLNSGGKVIEKKHYALPTASVMVTSLSVNFRSIPATTKSELTRNTC